MSPWDSAAGGSVGSPVRRRAVESIDHPRHDDQHPGQRAARGLVPQFERERGIDVKVIAVGTGAALRMAARGDADVVLVHAPAAEQRYVDSGDLIDGRLVMHNDFVIVGPPDDPAGLRRCAPPPMSMRAIAARASFVSRGDESGTHTQELRSGRPPRSIRCGDET